MSTVAAIWDERYSGTPEPAYHVARHEPWLDRWRSLIGGRSGWALELGCGPGLDTEVLLQWGFQVTALDISRAAVLLSKARNPAAIHVVADVRDVGCLAGTFDLVIASLSLHYFNRAETEAIFNAIHSRLKTGGFFAFRVNAFDDVESGAPGGSSAWECVSVGGVVKQFFTRDKIAAVLDGRYRVWSEEKLETRRYGHRKIFYEVIAQKNN